MEPAQPLSREPATVSVTDLRNLGGGLWSAVLTFPDLSRRRIVVPREVADLHGIRLSAAVVAELYAQGKLG